MFITKEHVPAVPCSRLRCLITLLRVRDILYVIFHLRGSRSATRLERVVDRMKPQLQDLRHCVPGRLWT